MRARLVGTIALMLACGSASCATAEPRCNKADFEAVVDEAAAALRTLNQQNTPPYQAKLRQLKDKRGWSHEQFLVEAAPLVRDDAIAGFDQKSEDFLARITQAGQSQATAAALNCGLLVELRGSLARLLETQKAKWAYMMEKIDAELAKGR